MNDMIRKMMLSVACICVANVQAMNEVNVEKAPEQVSSVAGCNECDDSSEGISVKVGVDNLIKGFEAYQNGVDVTDCFLMTQALPKDGHVFLELCNDGNIGACKLNPNDEIKFVFTHANGLEEEVYIRARN